MVYTVKFVVKKHSISSIYVKTVSSIIAEIILQNMFRTPHLKIALILETMIDLVTEKMF